MKKSIFFSIALICALSAHYSLHAGNCFSCLAKTTKYIGTALIIADTIAGSGEGIVINDPTAKEIIRKIHTFFEASEKLADETITQNDIFEFFIAIAAAGKAKITQTMSEKQRQILQILLNNNFINSDGTISPEMASLGVRALNEMIKSKTSRSAYRPSGDFIQTIYNRVSEQDGVEVIEIS